MRRQEIKVARVPNTMSKIETDENKLATRHPIVRPIT